MFRQFHLHPLALLSAALVTLLVLSGLARLATTDGGVAMLSRAGEDVRQQVVIIGHRVAQQVVVVGRRLQGR